MKCRQSSIHDSYTGGLKRKAFGMPQADSPELCRKGTTGKNQDAERTRAYDGDYIAELGNSNLFWHEIGMI